MQQRLVNNLRKARAPVQRRMQAGPLPYEIKETRRTLAILTMLTYRKEEAEKLHTVRWRSELDTKTSSKIL